ncbi:major facilitator superfamily domain-containing protein [Mycena rebaudengoi]|nr:major facilitator superfamily domain-containing protein [Mycena rebaudengoi]
MESNSNFRRSESAESRSPTPTLQSQSQPDAEKEIGEKISQIALVPGPPEGGLHAWLTIFGASLVSFATFGTANAFGAFNDYYTETYLSNYSATLISMIGSIQMFVIFIFAGLSGALFDAYGPRYMIPLSGFVASLSLFLLSISKPQQIYQQYLTHAVLYGLGTAFAFFPSLAICAHWFKRRLAFAIGFPVATASLGGIVYPIMISKIIHRIGFGWTVRIIAFIVLVCYIIASLTMSTPRPPKPLPRLSQLLAFRALRDPSYTCLCLGGWFTLLAVFNPFFYVGLYSAVTHGGAVPLTPYYLAIMCATAIVGRIAPGFVADRLGRFNVMCVSTALSGVFVIALWYTSKAEPNLIAFAVLYGLASGPFFPLLAACVAQISPIEEVGARVGMVFMFMSTGALAGTPIAGLFIHDKTIPNFRHLILFSGLAALVGSGFFCIARGIQSRKLFAAV